LGISGLTLALLQLSSNSVLRGAVLTLVPDHPNLYAASFATSSPKPSIRPLTNGSSKFIAAPRSNPHIVGGLYKIKGEELEDAGEDESSLLAS
jgi:hypothetical protein